MSRWSYRPELDGLRSHGELLQQVCATVQATEPRARITYTMAEQYRNMRYWLENDMRPVELAKDACRRTGVSPSTTPTRGGTDGSRLTEKGLLTPNLFTGGHQYHSEREWICVEDMGLAAATLVELARVWAEQ